MPYDLLRLSDLTPEQLTDAADGVTPTVAEAHLKNLVAGDHTVDAIIEKLATRPFADAFANHPPELLDSSLLAHGIDVSDVFYFRFLPCVTRGVANAPHGVSLAASLAQSLAYRPLHGPLQNPNSDIVERSIGTLAERLAYHLAEHPLADSHLFNPAGWVSSYRSAEVSSSIALGLRKSPLAKSLARRPLAPSRVKIRSGVGNHDGRADRRRNMAAAHAAYVVTRLAELTSVYLCLSVLAAATLCWVKNPRRPEGAELDLSASPGLKHLGYDLRRLENLTTEQVVDAAKRLPLASSDAHLNNLLTDARLLLRLTDTRVPTNNDRVANNILSRDPVARLSESPLAERITANPLAHRVATAVAETTLAKRIALNLHYIGGVLVDSPLGVNLAASPLPAQHAASLTKSLLASRLTNQRAETPRVIAWKLEERLLDDRDFAREVTDRLADSPFADYPLLAELTNDLATKLLATDLPRRSELLPCRSVLATSALGSSLRTHPLTIRHTGDGLDPEEAAGVVAAGVLSAYLLVLTALYLVMVAVATAEVCWPLNDTSDDHHQVPDFSQ